MSGTKSENRPKVVIGSGRGAKAADPAPTRPVSPPPGQVTGQAPGKASPPGKDPAALAKEQRDKETAALLASQNKGLTDQAFAMLKVVNAPVDQNAPPQIRQREVRRVRRSKDNFKSDKSDAKHRELYEYQRTITQSTLTLIEPYSPAADVLIKAFQDALAAAALKVPAGDSTMIPDYKGGEAALKAVDVKGAVAKAASLFDDALGKAKQKAPLTLAAITPLRETLNAADTPLSRTAAADFHGELNQATKSLLDKTIDGPLDRNVAAVVEAAGVRIGAAVRAADQARTEVTALRARLPELDTLEQTPTIGELPELDAAYFAIKLRQKNSAETAFQQKDFTTAKSLLTTLLNDVAAKQKALGEGVARNQGAWAREAGEANAIKGRARAVADNTATPPPLAARARQIITDLDEIAAKVPGKGITYAAALKGLEPAGTGIIELERLAQGAPAFDGEKKAAKARIATLVKDTNDAFNALCTAMEERVGAREEVIVPFEARLQTETTGWTARLQTAFDTQALDEAGSTQRLAALKKDIVAAGTAAGLQRIVDDAAAAQARTDYEVVRQKALATAEKLLCFDPVAGSERIGGIELVDAGVRTSQSAKSFAWAQKLLEQDIALMAKTAAMVDGMIAQARNELAALIAPIPAKLDQFQKLLEKMSTAKLRAPYDAMRTTLQTQYEELRALSQSVQLSLLNPAVREAKALVKEVDGALAAAANNSEPGIMAPEMAAKMLEKYKKDLADREIQTYATTTAFAVTERIEALSKGLGNQGPARLMEMVKAIGDEVVKVRTQAANAKLGFATLKAEADKAETVLKDKVFTDKGPAMVAAKKAELAGLLEDGRFEGGAADALAAIKALTTELSAMLKDPPNRLGVPPRIYQGQEDAVAAARAKELDKIKWDTEVVVVGKLLDTVKQVDPKEIDGLKTTLSDAKKAAEKSGDYGFGREQLMAIRTRLGLLKANPLGLVIAARGRLDQVNKAWRGAVVGFNQALDSVQKAIDATDLPDKDKGVVRQEMADVRGLFNPAAFDAAVTVMRDAKKNDEATRSAQRELGLREVRKMLAYIEGDYRMRELARSTFGAATGSANAKLELALLNLENNMLVSL